MNKYNNVSHGRSLKKFKRACLFSFKLLGTLQNMCCGVRDVGWTLKMWKKKIQIRELIITGRHWGVKHESIVNEGFFEIWRLMSCQIKSEKLDM